MEIEGVERGGPGARACGARSSRPVRRSPDEAERQQADDLLGLLTPVIKGYLTDKGFEAAVYAQQVLGGHGYIREHGIEQFVRDARITQIYEGTNGVQAMDLVGRKLPKDGGRGDPYLLRTGRPATSPTPRRRAIRPASPRRSNRRSQDLQAATMWLAQNGMADPDNAGAGAYAYMDLMGLVSLGWMWLKMARAASERLPPATARRTGLLRRQAHHRTLLCAARTAALDRAPPEDRGGRRNPDEDSG